jgi:adenosylcobinamide-GDP ribazoletransferase
MSALLEAIRFLTLIPVPFLPPMQMETYERNIARSMAWFPLVGLLIGGIGVAAWALGRLFWSEAVGAVFAVVAIGLVTGGLHLDGLQDTFDAVMSWRPRERKLEIMKDSRIGAMGAIALVAVVFLKVVLLALSPTPFPVFAALLIAPALGRWADLYGIFFFPPAAEGGLGKNFHDHIRRSDFAFATAQMLLITCGIGWAVAGVEGALRGGLALVAVLLFAAVIFTRWTRSLGGLTGDTYGAMCELAEVVAIAVLVANARFA